jgi:hypothetical protein
MHVCKPTSAEVWDNLHQSRAKIRASQKAKTLKCQKVTQQGGQGGQPCSHKDHHMATMAGRTTATQQQDHHMAGSKDNHMGNKDNHTMGARVGRVRVGQQGRVG